MAYSYITNQLSTTDGKPLDYKDTPLDSISDANKIDRTLRYIGMKITILNKNTTNIPCTICLSNGTSNSSWRIEAPLIVTKFSDLSLFSSTYIDTGLEAIVRQDETNDNRLSQYYAMKDNDGNIEWSYVEISGGAFTGSIDCGEY